MGESTNVNTNNSSEFKEVVKDVMNKLNDSGFQIDELFDYLKSHDTGNGIFRSGKDDGVLKGGEFKRAISGFTEGTIVDLKDAPKELTDALSRIGKEGINLQELEGKVRAADNAADGNGHISLKELTGGFSPQEIDQAADLAEKALDGFAK